MRLLLEIEGVFQAAFDEPMFERMLLRVMLADELSGLFARLLVFNPLKRLELRDALRAGLL